MPDSRNRDAAGAASVVTTISGTPEFPKDGLLPVIVQDYHDGEILMLAWSDRHAWDKTISEGLACFFSRSRQAYWIKGETSGHFLKVVSASVDCDNDTILYQAIPHGPTCHRNTRTCFAAKDSARRPFVHGFLSDLEDTIQLRLQEDDSSSYVATLARKGLSKILGKIGEEAAEVVVAATSEGDERLTSEAADLLFHLLVLLQYKGIPLHAVVDVLRQRDGVGGLQEKQRRNADT